MFPHTRKIIPLVSASLLIAPVLLAGCSRPQPTAEQLAGPSTPLTALHVGPTPPGGSSEAATGSGAGGSAAGGAQFGRVGSSIEGPTLPPQPAGITCSRMSPVGSSGSGSGDRGNPIPPDVSLTASPDPAPKRVLAPAKSVPVSRATQQRLLGHASNAPQGMTVTATMN
jgi:hypothetical protein